MHGGFYSGPESREARLPKAESAIGKVGLFIVEKLAKLVTLSVYGTTRFSDGDGHSRNQRRPAAPSGQANDFEVIAIPDNAQLSGGSLPEGQTVVIRGSERPHNPDLN